MDVLTIVLKWAKKHSEVAAVLFGGSRNKGTHTPTSDYDISVNLLVEPTPELVERLCADLDFENSLPAKVLSQISRHFLVIAKFYRPLNQPEVGVGFVNISLFMDCLKKQANYPLVTEVFEFIKHSEIIYDPEEIIKDLREKSSVAWAYHKKIQDLKGLAWWAFNKYQKALGKDTVVSTLFRTQILWEIAQIIAIINNVPLSTPNDYTYFKKVAAQQKNKFLSPPNFFVKMENLAVNEDLIGLEQLLQQTNSLAEAFLKE